MADVHFMLSAKAVGLGFAPPAGEAARLIRGDIMLIVEIEVDEAGAETSNCRITAQTLRPVNAKAYGLFAERWEVRQRPVSSSKSLRTGGFLVLPPGLFWLDAPAPVAELCADIQSELRGEATRLVRLLRWVGNRPWPAHLTERSELLWSLEREVARWASSRG